MIFLVVSHCSGFREVKASFAQCGAADDEQEEAQNWEADPPPLQASVNQESTGATGIVLA